MQRKGSVAAKIAELEPRSVFTAIDTLNLGVSDTIKHSVAIKDCFGTCFELEMKSYVS